MINHHFPGFLKDTSLILYNWSLAQSSIKNWLLILLVSCTIAHYCLVQLVTGDCHNFSLENASNLLQASESNCLLVNGTVAHGIV